MYFVCKTDELQPFYRHFMIKYANIERIMHLLFVHYVPFPWNCVCLLKIEQTNCKRKSSSFWEIRMHIHHALAQRESPKCPFNSAVKIVYINTADKICLLWQTLKMQKKPFEPFGVPLFSSFQLEIFIIFTLVCDTLSDMNNFQRTNVDIFYMIKLFKYFPVKFHSFQK